MCFSMTAVGNQSCDDYETDATRGVVCTWIVSACSTRGTQCGAVGSVCSTAAGFLESDFYGYQMGYMDLFRLYYSSLILSVCICNLCGSV